MLGLLAQEMGGPEDPPAHPAADTPRSADPGPVPPELWQGRSPQGASIAAGSRHRGAAGRCGEHRVQQALGTAALCRKSIQEEINLVTEQSLRPGLEGKP